MKEKIDLDIQASVNVAAAAEEEDSDCSFKKVSRGRCLGRGNICSRKSFKIDFIHLILFRFIAVWSHFIPSIQLGEF